jgi:hypothetical protein
MVANSLTAAFSLPTTSHSLNAILLAKGTAQHTGCRSMHNRCYFDLLVLILLQLAKHASHLFPENV